MSIFAQILFGLAVGLLTACLHLWMVRRATHGIVDRRRAHRSWLMLPVRIGVPALALLGVAQLGSVAFLTAFAALVLGQQLALAHHRRRPPA